MFSRLFLSLSLVLLFALGQQGAAMHAVSHLAADQQQDKSGHGTVCEQCVTYAKLGHALPAAVFAPPVMVQTHAAPPQFCCRSDSTHLSCYSARAPPSLA